MVNQFEERLLRDGRILSPSIIKVDSFLNHQVDPFFIQEVGRAFASRFRECNITKVLTVEASGIHIAMAAALSLGVPFVYAKKKKAVTQSSGILHASVFSFTRQETVDICITADYLHANDRILIVDDILAEGAAIHGLQEIVAKVQATIVGVGVVVEKSFQDGRRRLDQAGIPVYALARIQSMSDNGIQFLDTLTETKEETTC